MKIVLKHFLQRTRIYRTKANTMNVYRDLLFTYDSSILKNFDFDLQH